LSGNEAAVDHVRHIAVEDLVLSQGDKPIRHRLAHKISHETAISPVKCAQDNSP